MFIQTETTPNPKVLKFLPGREVMGEGTREFRAEDAAISPLAEALFALGASSAYSSARISSPSPAPMTIWTGAAEGADPGGDHGAFHRRRPAARPGR